MSKKRILICGSRDWIDYDAILREVHARCDEISHVISGTARGADTLGELAAKACKIPVVRFPANWKRYGRAAGPIRNQQMLDEGNPDEVWAFSPDLRKSRGTKDMVHRATKAGVTYHVFNE